MLNIPQCESLAFADDTALRFHDRIWEGVKVVAESGIKTVCDWLNLNLLTLSASKTKYSIIAISTRTVPKLPSNLKVHKCKLGEEPAHLRAAVKLMPPTSSQHSSTTHNITQKGNRYRSHGSRNLISRSKFAILGARGNSYYTVNVTNNNVAMYAAGSRGSGGHGAAVVPFMCDPFRIEPRASLISFAKA
ncbi:hypothetical protein EVAR_94859_1 [Eumeta japonica]|uniref:Uncharacterized protein n=1 Tax=Eumeta variegata TaxID=151549 RepID=A0A4C1V955_EUMVA|nr:hypothetical protein EVAR_94859_1 [Eumeta japonica]